jgi:hypothetical protein
MTHPWHKMCFNDLHPVDQCVDHLHEGKNLFDLGHESVRDTLKC